jgi:hypothetical protein
MQAVTTIGLDFAKSVFQVHGVDAAGQAPPQHSRSIMASLLIGSVQGRRFDRYTPKIEIGSGPGVELVPPEARPRLRANHPKHFDFTRIVKGSI